jgi:hypothetical protein
LLDRYTNTEEDCFVDGTDTPLLNTGTLISGLMSTKARMKSHSEGIIRRTNKHGLISLPWAMI